MKESHEELVALAKRHTLSIDHQLALRAASRRLCDEFSRTFTVDTVERFLAGSYDQYAASARFPHYVHLLAERYARSRLLAFSLAERHIVEARPIVVLVCQGNDLHSPMARGLLEKKAGDTIVAWSAGISPAVGLRDGVERVLHEVGISVSDEFPKPLSDEMLRAATTVVTFGCADRVQAIPGRDYLHVPAPEPPAGDAEGLRRLREWLDAGMATLLSRIATSPRPEAGASTSVR